MYPLSFEKDTVPPQPLNLVESVANPCRVSCLTSQYILFSPLKAASWATLGNVRSRATGPPGWLGFGERHPRVHGLLWLRDVVRSLLLLSTLSLEHNVWQTNGGVACE